MGSPGRGHWKLVRRNNLLDKVNYEEWHKWSPTRECTQIEYHVHVSDEITLLFSHDDLNGPLRVKLLREDAGIPCSKCSRIIKGPPIDLLQPLYAYGSKWTTAILRHIWEYHQEDLPKSFKSFSQFRIWLKTPEGRAWSNKESDLPDTEELMEAIDSFFKQNGG